MFRDQLTGKQSQPGQKASHIVTKTRPKEYWADVYNRKTKEVERKLVGKGFEIVEEKMVLPETAEEFNATKNEQKD
jgi:hypothetical protein